MATVEKSIEIDVPVRTAYNQYTQFEEFPRFMEGVKEVRQLDDTHLHWVAEISGDTHEWDAEITEQEPDQLIAWRSLDGKTNSGRVTFRPMGEKRCEVTVRLDWDEEGLTEKLGSTFGFDDRRVKGDLERFKEMIEERGVESGAWRGEVHQGSTR
jgi:uncharacterized membrane protein